MQTDSIHRYAVSAPATLAFICFALFVFLVAVVVVVCAQLEARLAAAQRTLQTERVATEQREHALTEKLKESEQARRKDVVASHMQIDCRFHVPLGHSVFLCY